jgi:tRNA(fMet)-specific endonuclease VapC
MYLLDTNILSEIIRTRPAPNVANRFEAASAEQLFTSVICLEEIRFGALIGPPGNRLWERAEAKGLSRVLLLPVDRMVALLAANLRADWKLRGTPVGYRDGLIAATAKAHDLVLVTRNVRHFDHVTGLKIENWFEPPVVSV